MNEEDYKKKHGLTDKDRVITKREEEIIRLLHHDFEGLTEDEAAERLGCTQQNISDAVARLKTKAPQLFPMMTSKQKFVYDCITEKDLKYDEIAMLLQVDKRAVNRVIEQLKLKGIKISRATKTQRYEDYLDSEIREKF